ncbi:hypothetical protein G4H71_03780 [Rhodococcus triatomae]|uniref:PASTA domain-containing protein n=1 Tax=Rhodococcus triatomae TaxID=300028 RepID=A0A1G7ZDN8_9NOCA|nr:hypothetical protein [Rhodococcus triatomae]QNG18059.1 hypothetical protein G4H72_04265 [Rhodococcus triatomae]QNG22271.1 hypothetical protein G4H71_03780 [Rhodococcus triatomae]SDH06794.1 hypothetical protein SAMN05444695_10181 [Rhodococcus triatomae]
MLVRRAVVTATLGAALATGTAVATAPAASAEPDIIPLHVVYEIPLDRGLTVAARDTGIARALADANLLVPIHGWQRVIDGPAGLLAESVDEAAALPNGCVKVAFLRSDTGFQVAQSTIYTNCPW